MRGIWQTRGDDVSWSDFDIFDFNGFFVIKPEHVQCLENSDELIT